MQVLDLPQEAAIPACQCLQNTLTMSSQCTPVSTTTPWESCGPHPCRTYFLSLLNTGINIDIISDV